MFPFSIGKKLKKSLHHIPQWLGFTYLLQSIHSFFSILKTQSLFSIGKKVFTPKESAPSETFDEVVTKLRLTETDLQNRATRFFRLMLFWLIVSTLIVCYAIYRALQGDWWQFSSLLALSLAILSYAFRYHFWLFQIKQRKLGCSMRDWFHAIFRRHLP